MNSTVGKWASVDSNFKVGIFILSALFDYSADISRLLSACWTPGTVERFTVYFVMGLTATYQPTIFFLSFLPMN